VIHQGIINIIGWLLVTSAIIGTASAASGIAYVTLRPDSMVASDSVSHLHDTYYIVRKQRSVVWPLLLCIALSSAVGIVGYIHTDRFINRIVEQDLRERQ
jgi:hypothetical protein